MEYPFITESVDKNQMVGFIFSCIDDRQPGSKIILKKRIRSAIKYASDHGKIKIISIDRRPHIRVDDEFLNWAISKWPELQKIENLPPRKGHISGHATMFPKSPKTSLLSYGEIVSDDNDELRRQLAECLNKFQKSEIENKELTKKVKEQQEELTELREYKKKRIETNRKNARKSLGVPKGYK